MAILEDAKKLAEQATGIGRPRPRDLPTLVRARKPGTSASPMTAPSPTIRAGRLSATPALSGWRSRSIPRRSSRRCSSENGWSDSWRNGVYDYLHYHSGIHEVMGVARGTAVVQFGGRHGRKLRLKAGDVIILPAGTGHQCFSASEDFLVVGAYPATGKYDVCRTSPKEHARAVKTVPKVPAPRRDPVYGKDGALLKALATRARNRRKKEEVGRPARQTKA